VNVGGGRLIALGALVAMSVAAPGTAAASGVREFFPDCTHFCETDIQYTALPGERNNVSANRVPGPPGSGVHEIVVRDLGAPLTPGQGCVALDAHTAQCEVYDDPDQPIGYGTFDLGDRSDRLNASDFGAPVVARGRTGNDRIVGGTWPDSLDAGPGHDVLDGGPGKDYAVYRDLDPRLRVDLASTAPQGAPGSRDVLRSIENLDATKVTGAVLIGDAGRNDLRAGRDGVVVGRGGNDYLDVRSGGRIEGGPGNDSLGESFEVGLHGAPRKLSCGGGSDFVTQTRLTDLVSASCEQIEPGYSIENVFDKLFPQPRRKHTIAILKYGCFIEENCPLTIVGRLGSADGRVLALRRIFLRFDHNGVVQHRYALRLNPAGQTLLRRRKRLRLCVYFLEGPYRTSPRYLHRNGFTMMIRG
jgi:hypothetical protein